MIAARLPSETLSNGALPLLKPTKRTAIVIPAVWIPQVYEYGAVLGRYTTGSIKTGMYGFPGGGVEKGETEAEAGERETGEETGCKVSIIKNIPPYQRTIEVGTRGPTELSYFMGLWEPKHPPKSWKLKQTREMDNIEAMTTTMIEGGMLGLMFETERVMWWEYASIHLKRLTAMRRAAMGLFDE